MQKQTSPDRAVKLVARYNREREQLEVMVRAVERKRDAMNRTYSDMFDALPQDFGIVLARDEPLYVTDPTGKAV